MEIITQLVILIVALIHGYFLVLEMFLWDKTPGLKAFGLGKDLASKTKVLGANQGLYNGFLSAGLLYGLFQGVEGYEFKVFFLICVIIAGIYGGITVSHKAVFFQAVPAIIGLLLIIF